MEIGLPLWLLIVVVSLIVNFIVWRVRGKTQPVFDRERRELRWGRTPPIVFGDIEEVGIFRYRDEAGGWWWKSVEFSDGPGRGYEWKYQVYVRVGNQRVYFDELRSKKKAEHHADEIRATIAESRS